MLTDWQPSCWGWNTKIWCVECLLLVLDDSGSLHGEFIDKACFCFAAVQLLILRFTDVCLLCTRLSLESPTAWCLNRAEIAYTTPLLARWFPGRLEMYSKDKVRRCVTLLNTPLAIFTGFGLKRSSEWICIYLQWTKLLSTYALNSIVSLHFVVFLRVYPAAIESGEIWVWTWALGMHRRTRKCGFHA